MRLLSLWLAIPLALACSEKKRAAPSSAPPVETASDPAKKKPGFTGEDPFERPKLQKTDSGFSIELVRRPGATVPAGRVPYSAEPYVMWAKHDGSLELIEANVLGTGLVLDLDGNGDTGGKVPIACQGPGKLVVAGKPVTPLVAASGGAMRYQDGERSAVFRIADIGASLLAYSACRDGLSTIGLAPGAMTVRTTEGPAVQVMVFEKAKGTTPPAPMALTVKAGGKDIEVEVLAGLDSEPIFGDDVVWTAMHWMMIPLDAGAERQTFEIAVPPGAGKRIATARVNLSGELHVRHAMSPGILELP